MDGNEDLDCSDKKIFSISAQEMVLIHRVLSQTSTRQRRWRLGPSSCAACSRLRGCESKTDTCVRVVGLLRMSAMLSSLSLHTDTHMAAVTGKEKPAYEQANSPIPYNRPLWLHYKWHNYANDEGNKLASQLYPWMAYKRLNWAAFIYSVVVEFRAGFIGCNVFTERARAPQAHLSCVNDLQ